MQKNIGKETHNEFRIKGVVDDGGLTKFENLPDDGQIDGAILNETESKYLLPHFLMLVIGRPGSGKSYMIKQLVCNKRFYKGRFTQIFAISPSVQKLGLPLPRQNTNTLFELDWIFQHIHVINEQQLLILNKMFGMQYKIKPPPQKAFTKQELVHQRKLEEAMIKADMLANKQARVMPANTFTFQNFNKTSSLYQRSPMQQNPYQINGSRGQVDPSMEGIDVNYINAEQAPHYLKMLSKEQKEEFHQNILFIFDDVIGTIKKLEYEPRLAQLIMNRRHLIINGTISIILVSQKFSLIPQRIRSNCNWAVLFKLNPVDEDFVYKDLVAISSKTWSNILRFVFGDDSGQNRNESCSSNSMQESRVGGGGGGGGTLATVKSTTELMKNKKYDNLGIWVDYGIFFMNFKQILIEKV